MLLFLAKNKCMWGKDMSSKKKELLFSVAARLFREKGYHEASTREISEVMGVQKSSLYYYVDSKEDLLYKISLDSIKTFIKNAKKVVSDPKKPIAQKILELIATHIKTLVNNVDIHATMLKELDSLSIERREEIVKLRDEYEKIVRGIIEEGVKRGEFRKLNPKIVSFALLGMMNWMMKWYSEDGELSPCEIAKIFSDIFLFGLKIEK